MPLRTKLQIVTMIGVATGAVFWGMQYPSYSWLEFSVLLVVVLLSSGMKVALPDGDGSMSLNFPFILLAVVRFSSLQAMCLAALSVLVQCRIRVNKGFTYVQIAFNVANGMVATAGACVTYATLVRYGMAIAPSLAIGAVTYFFFSTGAVAAVMASTKGLPLFSLWIKEFRWYLPFYILGAILASVADLIALRYGWGTSMLLVPFVYIVYRSYTSQQGRIREREEHLEEMEALHRRTIEGLAMAIEAKDQGTHDHLFRVRSYVQYVGNALNIGDSEMAALRIAAFLHDIGKLAVPEHIIKKPGKLSPEEFEKMKIHPVVGADILERVRFPYPVVPIVRSHHEWWDGGGYPDGLKGSDIPIGARILSVVDCFDALVSDRPYRKGVPPEVAMATVKSLAGTQFDPEVVAILGERYREIERQITKSQEPSFVPLNTTVEVLRGAAPGAGFEEQESVDGLIERKRLQRRVSDSAALEAAVSNQSLNLIASASQEAQTLFQLTQSLGNSLSLNETLSVMASRLRRLVHFDSCALYLRSGDGLTLQYVDGEQARFFSSRSLAIGDGLSGWVAQNARPIVNGDPTLESCYVPDPKVSGRLCSALSMPIFLDEKEVFGVLTLYAQAEAAFSRDHLRILQATESKLSLALQNVLHFKRAEFDAETDYLTGLPNARRFFVLLGSELERCRQSGDSLAVIVCDLNSFKEVNDRSGHLVGDRLLKLIADGFRHSCRVGDTVARMGGDEFVFLIQNLAADKAEAKLQAISATVRASTRQSAVHADVSASLGIAFFPADCHTAEDLLALADRRMYLQKRAHHGNATPVSEIALVSKSLAL